MPVKQVNILHSTLNPFFAVYQNANFFFFSLLRVTIKVEPAWKWEHLNETANQWLQERSM